VLVGIDAGTSVIKALAEIYDRLFPIYRDAREAMHGVWPALAGARREAAHGA
jgi:hypothetical protein